MFRSALLLFTILPLAAFAVDEEVEIEPVLDRKYECHDRYSPAKKATPYIFVEVFVAPEDIPELSDEVDPDEMTDDEQLALIMKIVETMSEAEFSTVTISDTEFRGTSYQDGLDYRVDFGTVFEFEDFPGESKYTLIIQADGDAAFYDFSDAEPGEKKTPERQLECKRTQ